MRRWRLLLVLALILTAAWAATAVAVSVNVLTEDLPHWLDFVEQGPVWWSAGSTFGVGLVGVALWWAQQQEERALPEPTPAEQQPSPWLVDRSPRLRRAAAGLAAAVAEQWRRELGARSVLQPHPLVVSWSSTGRPVAAPAAAILPGFRVGRLTRLTLAGDTGDLAAQYRRLPHGQLVVLGDAGSGKTVFVTLLMLDLLRRPIVGDLVPVLLSLATWNPVERLDIWMARRLLEDYPDLAGPALEGDLATALIAAGGVLPVLDGLDEMAPALRSRAIEQIEAACSGRRFVLTCRGDEYESTVLAGDRFLSAAAVVELEPVPADRVIPFVTARIRHGDRRWEEVLEHLREYPVSPVAAALSSPLVMYLALATYAAPGSRPRELLDCADRNEVEERLLSGYVPAVYSPRWIDGDVVRLVHHSPDRAERWLAVLATVLHRNGQVGLAWWRLGPGDRWVGEPRRIATIVAGLVVLAVVGGAAVTGRTALGAAIGLGLGIMAAAAAAGMVAAPLPRRATFRGHDRRELMQAMRAHFVSWCTAGFLVGGGTGLVAALVLEAVSTMPSSVNGWLLDGLLAGLLTGTAVSLLAGLSGGLVGWLQTPVEEIRARDPAGVLRDDRSIALVNGGVAAVVSALAVGLPTAVYVDTPSAMQWSGITALVAVVATVLGTTAWGRFCLVRLWLAARGELPLRLMRFLNDAHRRGVLRQVGGVYQFRHLRLRDRLVQSPLGAPARRAAPLEPPVEGTNAERDSRRSMPYEAVAQVGLYIAAVIATSLMTFLTLYAAVPENSDRWTTTTAICVDLADFSNRDLASAADIGRAQALFASCVGPVYAERGLWVLYGLTAMTAVALLLLYLQPRAIRRRFHYRALNRVAFPEVIDAVRRLSSSAGLARPPALLLSSITRGQRVFGRPGRYYLGLSAESVAAFSSDRARFDAMTMHSLAHIRNGDVGRYYAMIAIWRSWLLFGLLPFVPALVVVTDSGWQRFEALVSVLVLAVLAGLTHAAVLRRSEIYADTAAARAGHGGPLHELLERSGWRNPPRWRAWLGTHSLAEERATRLRAPDRERPTSTWVLVGVGMTAAIMTSNIGNFLGSFLLESSLIGTGLAVLLCVPGVVATLLSTAWAATARTGTDTPVWIYVRPGLTIAAGFVAGQQLAISGALEPGTDEFGEHSERFAVAVVLLLVGLVFVTAWLVSAVRSVRMLEGRRHRRTLVGLFAAGCLAVAPWFAAWSAFEDTGLTEFSTFEIGSGFYGHLSAVVNAFSPPLSLMFSNPLTLPAVLLLSLAPLVVARRLPASQRPRTDLAMLAGLLSGAVVVAGGVVLAWQGQHLVPTAVRADPYFPLLFFNMYVALAVVGQAAVAFVVACRASSGRLALALFAALLTALVATSGMRIVLGVARCSGLSTDTASGCLSRPIGSLSTDLVHWIVVKGAIAAVVATALAVAAGSLSHRRRSAPTRTARPSLPSELLNQVVTVVTVVVLVVAALEQIPDFLQLWSPWGST